MSQVRPACACSLRSEQRTMRGIFLRKSKLKFSVNFWKVLPNVDQSTFLWMPRKMWQVKLHCPHSRMPSASVYPRVSQELDIDGFYILAQMLARILGVPQMWQEVDQLESSRKVNRSSGCSSLLGKICRLCSTFFTLSGVLLSASRVTATHCTQFLWPACLAAYLSGINKTSIPCMQPRGKSPYIANGIKNPSSEAVRRAVGKKELGLHCQRRTKGAETTENLLDSLFTTIASATDVLGVPLFREEMLTEI